MNLNELPNAKKHFYISMVKSALRMVAGFTLAYGFIVMAGVLFIAAEGLGVLEEMF